MIYSIFIKKTEGDYAPFPLADVIKNFISKIGDDVFLLGWPGYIGVNSNSIDDFKRAITPKHKHIILKGYFFPALNGMRNIKHPLTGANITTNKYQNEIFGDYSCSHTGKKDHSKILAFIRFNNDFNKFNNTEFKNLDEFLLQGYFDVLAILIGSSNQSQNTYCNSPTPKGEADVFMFDSQFVKTKNSLDFIDSLFSGDNIVNENHQIVISQQLQSGNRRQTTLKEIVLDLLKIAI